MAKWVHNPGGKNCPGKFTRIDVRFHGALCYIDAYAGPSRRRSRSISAAFVMAARKIDGASPGTPTPMKNTNQAVC